MGELKVELRMNVRRFNALSQEARARIRRAPKGERGKMLDMYAKRIAAECVYMSTSKKPLHKKKSRTKSSTTEDQSCLSSQSQRSFTSMS